MIFYLDLVWEEINKVVIDLFDLLFKEYEKFSPLYELEFNLLKNGHIQEFKEVLMTKPKLQKKCVKILEIITKLQAVITLDEIGEGMVWFPYAWGACPTRIIGTYCAHDSYMTARIWDLLY